MGYNKNFYDTDLKLDIVGYEERQRIARNIKSFDKSFNGFVCIDSNRAKMLESAGAVKVIAEDVKRDGTTIRTWYHNGRYYLCKD